MPYTGTPRTWVAGEVPTAAQFNANLRDFARGFTDAWTSYTPTLTASTTNPTNWTSTGYYMRAGKLVIAKFKATASATFTAGSGTYRIALPVNASTTFGDIESGVAVISHSASRWICSPTIQNTAYLTFLYPQSVSTAGYLSHNAPVATWANGSFIRGSVTYEAA